MIICDPFDPSPPKYKGPPYPDHPFCCFFAHVSHGTYDDDDCILSVRSQQWGRTLSDDDPLRGSSTYHERPFRSIIPQGTVTQQRGTHLVPVTLPTRHTISGCDPLFGRCLVHGTDRSFTTGHAYPEAPVWLGVTPSAKNKSAVSKSPCTHSRGLAR